MKWYIYEKIGDPSKAIIGLAETPNKTNYDNLVIKIDMASMTATRDFQMIDRTKYTRTELDQHILNVIVLNAIFKLQPTARWFKITSTDGESSYIYASIFNYITTEDSKIKLKDVYIFKSKEKVKLDRVSINLERIETIEETSIEPIFSIYIGDIYTWSSNYCLILERVAEGYKILVLSSDNIYTTYILSGSNFWDWIKYESGIYIQDLSMKQIVTKFINKINE